MPSQESSPQNKTYLLFRLHPRNKTYRKVLYFTLLIRLKTPWRPLSPIWAIWSDPSSKRSKKKTGSRRKPGCARNDWDSPRGKKWKASSSKDANIFEQRFQILSQLYHPPGYGTEHLHDSVTPYARTCIMTLLRRQLCKIRSLPLW